MSGEIAAATAAKVRAERAAAVDTLAEILYGVYVAAGDMGCEVSTRIEVPADHWDRVCDTLGADRHSVEAGVPPYDRGEFIIYLEKGA